MTIRGKLGVVDVCGRSVGVYISNRDAELTVDGVVKRAWFDGDKQTIMIDSRLPDRVQEYLYHHECGHAVLTYSKLDDEMNYEQEERMIDRGFVPYLDVVSKFPYSSLKKLKK